MRPWEQVRFLEQNTTWWDIRDVAMPDLERNVSGLKIENRAAEFFRRFPSPGSNHWGPYRDRVYRFNEALEDSINIVTLYTPLTPPS